MFSTCSMAPMSFLWLKSKPVIQGFKAAYQRGVNLGENVLICEKLTIDVSSTESILSITRRTVTLVALPAMKKI